MSPCDVNRMALPEGLNWGSLKKISSWLLRDKWRKKANKISIKVLCIRIIFCGLKFKNRKVFMNFVCILLQV
jgi:hypothetical protein